MSGTSVAEKGLQLQEPLPPLEIEVIWDPKNEKDRWGWYDVHGENLKEAREFMEREKVDKWARFECDPTYDILSDREGNVKKVTLLIRVKITMPKWLKRDQQDQEAKDAWDLFYDNLKCHENGHNSILNRHLIQLVTDLKTTESRQYAHIETTLNKFKKPHMTEQESYQLLSKGGTIDYGPCKAVILPILPD